MNRVVAIQTNTTPKNRLRTFVAALFGAAAIWLILASIFTVWLNHTLTDTETFSATVAPLATNPAVQNFVIQKVTDTLLQSNPTQQLAASVLPNAQAAGVDINQLQVQVQTMVHDSVAKIVTSPQFVTIWQTTTTSAQKQLVSQLNGVGNNFTLDLSPAVTGIVDQLKQTNLAPFANSITIAPDTAKLSFKSSGLQKAHQYYKDFQRGKILIIALAVVMTVLAVVVSVQHMKTIRRILIFTGFELLILAAVLQLPSIIKPGTGAGSLEKAAALAFAQVLLHNLQVASLIIGSVCVVLALASKIYSAKFTTKTPVLKNA